MILETLSPLQRHNIDTCLISIGNHLLSWLKSGPSWPFNRGTRRRRAVNRPGGSSINTIIFKPTQLEPRRGRAAVTNSHKVIEV